MKPPSTPGRSSSSSSNHIQTTPKRKPTRISNSNTDENTTNSSNSTGADLLIYLATSPYTKTDSSSTRMKIPTTPRSSSFGQLASDDTIRLSHLKPSLTSPQSTLKNGNHLLLSQNDLLNGNNSHNSAFNNNMLLESPSLYNNPTIGHTANNNNNNANNNIHINPNPSGFNPNLLKTPNFNMGDYIHNLFSPSPNINLNQITKERSINNLRRDSISNSLAQVALLSTSGLAPSAMDTQGDHNNDINETNQNDDEAKR